VLALQSNLDEPSPALLDHGLRSGGVLLATAAGEPVGYLLAVGVRFAAGSGSDEPRTVTAPETAEAANGRQSGVGPASGLDHELPTRSDYDAPSAHLAELAVAPGHRRRGHGGRLLDALLARSRRVTVTVAPGNDAALALYRSRGFERVGHRPDAFADGAALVLARTTRAGRPSGP
jgi:ribosomal protein S18 acetylase RimI-like enzyme